MAPEDYSFDLYRIFIGEWPPLIYAEILLRTTLLYLYTLLLMRIIDRRETAQMSYIDAVLIIALGSGVGDPMFYPDIPLLFGCLIVTVVVVIQRAIYQLLDRVPQARPIFEAKPQVVVRDGEFDEDGIHATGLNRPDVEMLLRQEGIEYLEEVRLALLEPSGRLSIFRNEKAHGRTSVLPEIE